MATSNIKPLTKKDLTESLAAQTRDFDKKLNDRTKNLATKKDLEDQTEALAVTTNTSRVRRGKAALSFIRCCPDPLPAKGSEADHGAI